MESLNIDKIGPGAWYLIHLVSVNAKTEAQIMAVHEVFKIVAESFFCLKCRHHFAENMRKYPPPCVNKYNELFIWSVEMHNRVNVLNGKPEIKYREALDYYSGSSAECSGDCGAKPPTSLVVSEQLLAVLSSGDSSKFRKPSDLV